MTTFRRNYTLKSLGMTGLKNESHLGRPLDRSGGPIEVDTEQDLYKNSNFARISTGEAVDLVKLAVKKIIQYRDIAVLLAMMSVTDYRDGKCKAKPSAIANIIGWQVSQVSHSLRRLKAASVLTCVTEKRTGETYHIFNPYLLIYGSGKRRGYLIKVYTEAIHQNTPQVDSESFDKDDDLDVD